MTFTTDIWERCYNERWKGIASEDSFKHPAKYSRSLIRRIYQHLVEEGWLRPNSVVLDPFGGVALGGLDAALLGAQWVGCELEARFASISHRNVVLWMESYGCICGENAQLYMRAVRESGLSTPVSSQENDQGFLFGGVPQCVADGSGFVAGEGRAAPRQNPVEQGQALVEENETEAVEGRKQWLAVNGEERKLEGRAVDPQRRVCGDSSERQAEARAHRRNGETPRATAKEERNSSPSENPPRQRSRGSRIDDAPGAHEASQSARPQAARDNETLRDLPSGVSHETPQSGGLLGELQTRAAEAILEAIRRKAQTGPNCPSCGRLVLIPPQQIQGDSRRLSNVLREAGLLVSSPPYSNDTVHGRNGCSAEAMTEPGRTGKNSQALTMNSYGDTEGNLGNLPSSQAGFSAAVSSPPYVESLSSDDPTKRGGLFRDPKRSDDKTLTATYGESDGQLGAMKEGAFDVAISSPPYAESNQNYAAGWKYIDPAKSVHSRYSKQREACYGGDGGESEGQLGQMRESKDGFDVSVPSPPWEKGAEGALRKEKFKDPEAFATSMSARDGNGNRHAASPEARRAQLERDSERTYGDSQGQLGMSAGQDFWSAARLILEQTYSILAPGAHAVWVLKGFVRKGAYVDFPDQWRRLCEAVGFETAHWHNASLVEHSGSQGRLDGGEDDQIKREKKSFFRRLSEQKGSPRIDFEVVLCTRKPVYRNDSNGSTATEE